MKRLICFGDSITARDLFDNGAERLTPRLQRSFSEWNIINAGISGDNTRNALSRLENDVLRYKPDLVIILFGANDAASHKLISIEEYAANLVMIVQRIGHRKTILITPAPVDEARPRNRTNEVLLQYAEAVKRVALLTGSQFIDLYAEMIKCPDYIQMLSDGLHFEESGYVLLSQLVIEKASMICQEQADTGKG
jgi:lysophospholipase L1-like esterase